MALISGCGRCPGLPGLLPSLLPVEKGLFFIRTGEECPLCGGEVSAWSMSLSVWVAFDDCVRVEGFLLLGRLTGSGLNHGAVLPDGRITEQVVTATADETKRSSCTP